MDCYLYLPNVIVILMIMNVDTVPYISECHTFHFFTELYKSNEGCKEVRDASFTFVNNHHPTIHVLQFLAYSIMAYTYIQTKLTLNKWGKKSLKLPGFTF